MLIKSKNITTIINLLLIGILLNSCDHINQAEEEPEQTHENIYEPNDSNHEQEAACPNCKEGSRYLYKLSNGIIVLCCEECSALWLDPGKIGWGGAVSNKVLASIFNNQTVNFLFDDVRSHWATEDEVRKSPWSVKLTNQLLLRNY